MPGGCVGFQHQRVSLEPKRPCLRLSHPVREPSAFNAMNHCASLWVYTEGPPIPYVVTPRSFSFLSRGVEWVATHKGGSGGSHELRRHLPIALVQNATDRAITERLRYSAGGKP